ncbi:MAG: DEAD/DEAH box helicase [Acidimicrobiia bacterium]
MTRGPEAAAAPRSAFESGLGFSLDDFQRRACDALDDGHSVLVAAPTGSGKTVVAEYAVARALADGAKAFYTTPLKALSNQKFGDFVRTYGSEAVGLLTGDNSVNPWAPVVVMTTEVLRNMIYSASDALDGLRYVVLDEVHFLQDLYRGAVWEEVIIHLPAGIDLVCLSATVSNAEEVAAWIETVRGDTTAIIEESRPVELEQIYLVGERGTDHLRELPMFVGPSGRPNADASRLDAHPARGHRRRLRTPGRTETLQLLDAQHMLPAIQFVFSRAGCDQAVDECVAAGVRLTDEVERDAIARIVEAHTGGLTDADLVALGYARWRTGLEDGVASHHAGLVPPMKEAVEEAFAAGLVKIVYATETLALGINMPARTVAIERLTKFTGERHEFLTPGEYTQLTGRAGRRGIDEVGYSVVWWSPFVTFDQVAGLASRRTYALRSSFRPNYNMAANLVRRYDRERAHHLLNLSFAQFHADRHVVALERDLARARAQLAREQELARSPYGDIDEYRQHVEGAVKNRGGGDGLARLRPGDVVRSPRRGGRLLVLRREGRSGTRILALTDGAELVRLHAGDFDRAPESLGHVELPVPFAPRRLTFRREAAAALRTVALRAPSAASDDSVHPVEADPRLSERLRAADRVGRMTTRVERLERRVRSRSESLARQLDRVLSVLDAWRYIDGWALTEAGELLARLYSECDLLVAESLRQGLLDELEPAELAAVVSCFTYERRGSDEDDDGSQLPTAAVATRVRVIGRIARDLEVQERDARLPMTRGPDPGITGFVYAWASGADLSEVLDEELTGCDFVRHMKQCIDLLRQVGDAAPDSRTAATARRAAEACQRGVVAASGLIG